MGTMLFSKQFKRSVEKLVMESFFVLHQDPLRYHGLNLTLYEFMKRRCPTSKEKDQAWESFLQLVQEYKQRCETSTDTMRKRHQEEEPSIHLQKALNFSVNDRGGLRRDVAYKTLIHTFSAILEDLKRQKLTLDGNDFYSVFQILNLFSYTDFNPALQFFWRKFHSSKTSNKKKRIPKNSTVTGFQEAYDLIKGEDKRCFLCNEFKRKKTFNFKFLKQHLSCFHSIYSFNCDWSGCTETFDAWRYVTTHKKRFHSQNLQVHAKENEENEGEDGSRKNKNGENKENEGGDGSRKRKNGVSNNGKLAKRAKHAAAKPILDQEKSSLKGKSEQTVSSMSKETGTITILNFDPNLLHPTCEKVINDLCGIIETYDPTVKVTAPFTYDVTTGILDRKVQIQPKVQVHANPVLSSPQQCIPGLSNVQQEVEL